MMLHTRESGRGITLIVSGDGDLRSYTFQDIAALMTFEAHMEDFLLETGWTATHAVEPRTAVEHPVEPATGHRPGASH